VGQPQSQDASSQLDDIIAAAKPHLTNGGISEVGRTPDPVRENNKDYGRTNKVYRRIDTGDARPIRQPPRRVPLAKQREVNEMLDNLERRGVIKESESSPVVLSEKRMAKFVSPWIIGN
jgi:hypothetical protein